MERIAQCIPIDKTAGMVTQKGFSYKLSKNHPGHIHSKIMLPTRPVTYGEIKNPAFKNLTGMKTGRFVIIGLYAEKGSGGSRWVVRCVCGHYELRRTKYLLSALSGSQTRDAMCEECDRLQYITGRQK